jgi:hypothetical protein
LRSLIVSILTGLHRFGIVEEENDNWRIPSRLPREKQDLVDISKYPKLVSATHIIEKEYEKLRLGGVSNKNSIDKARKILEEVSTEVMTDKTEPHALQVKIILERAKCSALDGDWQTAFTLMGKAEAAAQTHDIDAGLLHAELRSVWSYTEAACLDPELVQIDNCITQRDYSQIRDALLIVHRLLHLSQPWNSAAHFATKLLRIALDMTRALEESQREYEPIIESSMTQRQQVDYEKEEAKSIIGQWQPAQEIENRMLSVKFR